MIVLPAFGPGERPGIIMMRPDFAFDGGQPLDEGVIDIASQSPSGRYE